MSEKTLNPGRELDGGLPKHGSFSGFSENRGLRTPVFVKLCKKSGVLAGISEKFGLL